jgi:thiosulfate reductase cytochrome b subunit
MMAATDKIKIHPLYVRIFHWINAIAMVMMIMSGWQIYNAAPVFESIEFPDYLTLGGWLGGGIQFHLAVMWVFVINLLIYFFVSIFSGHYRRSLFPVTPMSILGDLGKALRGKLPHTVGAYNSVQKISYIGVIVLMIVVFLSGLAIWKSVQFQAIGYLFGGYDGARIVHFVCMSLICAFIVMHLVLVAIVPSTFIPMITGWARKSANAEKEIDHVV